MATCHNIPSATDHPEVVDVYLSEERMKGRILGPFQPVTIDSVRISRMGVIPKGHVPGKWLLITDLSFQETTSVNRGIDPALCSLALRR